MQEGASRARSPPQDQPQDKPKININSVTDLIAAVPLMFRFQPVDSFVVFPLTPGMAFARIDHPHDPAALLAMAASLGAAYRRHPGARVVLVAYTNDETHAVDAITAVTAMLDGVADVVDALVIDQPRRDSTDPSTDSTSPGTDSTVAGEWFSIGTGQRGVMDPSDVARISAEFALAGRPAPAASRAEVAADLIASGPDAEAAMQAIARAIKTHAAVRTAEARIADQPESGEAADEAEAAWIRRRVEVFVYDQEPLSVEDAARMLHAITGSLHLRDAAWMAITRDQALTHVALWRDLVRRAPAAQRTPAAALLAFSAWVAGVGALSWVALDLIPTSEDGEDGGYDYTLPRLVAECLTNVVNPDTWGPQQ